MLIYLYKGADVVGLNCHFGPDETLQAIRLMKAALDKEGLKPYLMTQPLGFKTPDCNKQGFIDLPEFPFGEFSCEYLFVLKTCLFKQAFLLTVFINCVFALFLLLSQVHCVYVPSLC